MILKTIQENLQKLYQFELEQDVEDFLVKRGGAGKETLWIRSQDQEIQVALFIDPVILKKLGRENPFQQVTGRNLNAFAIAIEGVSHFVYFLKKAHVKRPVTRLELELQAEVDKYLLISLLFVQQRGGIPDFLFASLFENFCLTPSLNREEQVRYREANRFATKFCADLNRNFLRARRWRQVLEEARHFYALDHWGKIAQLTP